MPSTDDNGSPWNAWKCAPLADDPKAVDEACTVEDSPVSGIDDCGLHSMCWDVDPETLMGECVAFCSGSEANPTCEEPCTSCSLSSAGILNVCLPMCDPLAQNCYEGEGCYAADEGFVCAPDASEENGALGDPCEYINVCDPGLFCALDGYLPTRPRDRRMHPMVRRRPSTAVLLRRRRSVRAAGVADEDTALRRAPARRRTDDDSRYDPTRRRRHRVQLARGAGERWLLRRVFVHVRRRRDDVGSQRIHLDGFVVE